MFYFLLIIQVSILLRIYALIIKLKKNYLIIFCFVNIYFLSKFYVMMQKTMLKNVYAFKNYMDKLIEVMTRFLKLHITFKLIFTSLIFNQILTNGNISFKMIL